MKKIVVLFACIFAVPLLMGAHYNINGINTQVMATSQTIAGSGTFTSSACTLMGKCENLSIQYQLVSGTTPDVTFKITTSLDETNFATPDTGGTVKANLTTTELRSAVLSIPVCKALKVVVVNNTANSVVVSATVGGQ